MELTLLFGYEDRYDIVVGRFALPPTKILPSERWMFVVIRPEEIRSERMYAKKAAGDAKFSPEK
jgi:hypothetical protein